MKKLAIALITLTLIAVPTFAFANDVSVSAFSTYESKYRGFSANIVTPVVDGMKDEVAERALNDKLLEDAFALIYEYEKDVSKMLKENPNEDGHMGVESNFEVKTDNRRTLAFDVYVFNVAGSSSTVHNIYVIDKQKSKLVTLEGLFKKDANYVAVLSKYIKKEMERRNAKENGMFWVKAENNITPFMAIRPDQSFYLSDAGNIVICFDKYEVAAGAQGSPEFEIPASVVKGILAK